MLPYTTVITEEITRPPKVAMAMTGSGRRWCVLDVCYNTLYSAYLHFVVGIIALNSIRKNIKNIDLLFIRVFLYNLCVQISRRGEPYLVTCIYYTFTHQ